MERMTLDQLKSLYASNKTLFQELANKWYVEDQDYYRDFVYPILNAAFLNQSPPTAQALPPGTKTIIRSAKKKISKEFIYALLIIGGIIFVFSIAKFFGGSSDRTTTSTKTSTNTSSKNETKTEYKSDDVISASVYASTLYDAYHANEVSADSKYKGEKIEVTGNIQEIRKDFLDNVIIDLETKNQFMPIRCEVLKSHEKGAGSLSKGKTITIKGKCKGLILGSVMMDDCTF